MMTVFRCSCDWKWVITKRSVYGPMKMSGTLNAFVMDRNHFKTAYRGCHDEFRRLSP